MAYEAPGKVDSGYETFVAENAHYKKVRDKQNIRNAEQAKANALPVLNSGLIYWKDADSKFTHNFQEDGTEYEWHGTAEKETKYAEMFPDKYPGYFLSLPNQESKPADKRIDSPKEVLYKYPQLRHIEIKLGDIEFTAVLCAMEEYAKEQLKEAVNKKLDEVKHILRTRGYSAGYEIKIPGIEVFEIIDLLKLKQP